MRKYELMLILPAEADDKVVTTVTDRVGQLVGEHGGQITNVDRWGKRRLAYEIRKMAEGYYVVVDFMAEPDAIKEIDRVLTLADEVVRFKVVAKAA